MTLNFCSTTYRSKLAQRLLFRNERSKYAFELAQNQIPLRCRVFAAASVITFGDFMVA